MNNIKISLACKAFAVLLINVDIKSLGLIKLKKLFETFQNGDMKGLRGFAFTYEDVFFCFNDEIFGKLINNLFGAVFDYERSRRTVNGERIYVHDSISCSLEHEIIIEWVASLIGLSIEDANDVLMKAFMDFLEVKYRELLEELDKKVIVKKRKEAEVLLKQTWADKSRSGIDYSSSVTLRKETTKRLSLQSPESSQTLSIDSDSQNDTVGTGGLSSLSSSSKSVVTIESLSEMIEKLDNRSLSKLLDNIDNSTKSRLGEVIFRKKEIMDVVESCKVESETVKRVSARVALLDEVDYDETKNYTNNRLREQMDILSGEYTDLRDQYVLQNRELETLKRNERRSSKKAREDVSVVEKNNISIQTDIISENTINDANDNNNSEVEEIVIPFEKRLAELIEEKGKLFTLIKGQKTMSLHSGMILQNMISSCGCSMKKLPHIIGSVLTLYFGQLEQSFLNHFVKTSSTYDDAMTRASTAFNNFNKSLFTGRNNNEMDPHFSDNHVAVQFMCLIVDGANKKGKNLNAKPIVYFGVDGNVHQMSLHTDLSYSKKHGIQSEATFDSMVLQLSEIGVSRTMGAGCDKFAEGELSKVLNLIDDLCNTLWNNNVRDTLIYLGINKVIYRFGIGSFRKYRVWTCLMHATENILKPILRSMLNTRGLGKDTSLLSNMFKIHYYNSSLKDKFNFLNVISVGNDVSRLSELPSIIKRTFKEIADTRWLSQERQCDELIQFLEVPASEDLINFVKIDFTPHRLNEFDSLMKKSSCWNNPNIPSHYILQFLYLANHSAGGDHADKADSCRDLASMLMSPYTRIVLAIFKEFYKFHCHVAKFANGKSKIPNFKVSTISTRLLEAPVYYRRMYKFFYDLKLDWKNIFNTFNVDNTFNNFLVMELQRAHELQVPHCDTIEADINERMTTGINECWEVVVKYMEKPFFTQSFSIILVLVNELSAHWAAGLLEGLEISEYITLTDIERQSFIDSNLDLTNFDVDILNNHHWTNVNDPYFAYPNMTYLQFRESIRKSFTLENGRETIAKKDKNRNIDGLVNGYGLMCDEIIQELVSIASGEHLNDPLWKSGDAVKNYFNQFDIWYPNVTECLVIHFIYMSITSTISEQSFSISTNLTQANTTGATEKRNLDFWLNCRAKLVRELMDSDYEYLDSETELEVSNSIKRGRKRLLEKKSAVASFLHKVCEMTDEVYNYNNVTGLKRSLGKKKEQIRHSMPIIEKELDQNFRGYTRMFGDEEYTNYMKAFADAYRLNAEMLQRPIAELTLIDKFVSHASWNAASVKNFLRIKDIEFTEAVAKVTKAVRRRNDAPYPDMKITYDYLREYIIREAVSENIISEYISLLDQKLLTIEYMNNNFVVVEEEEILE